MGGTYVHLASGMGSIHHYDRGHEVNLSLNKYWECRGNDGFRGWDKFNIGAPLTAVRRFPPLK